MKKFKVTKILSGVMAVVFAVSIFTVGSEAKVHSAAAEQQRELTAEEIAAIRPMFKADQYAAYYPDVVKVLGEDEEALFTHFITSGIWEERQPSVSFNVDVYASENYDLQSALGNDIVAYYMHYATTNEYRRVPAPAEALRLGYNIYSVYDFVQGKIGPQKGAAPVLTPDYHPGIVL